MGFRFRKSLKLLPGVRLNLSTRGVSTSLGGRGATVNIGRRGARATLGIPGTGLSYTTALFGRSRRVAEAHAPHAAPAARTSLGSWIATLALLLLIGSCVAAIGSTAQKDPASATPVTGPAVAMRTVAADDVNCRAAPVSGTVLAKLDRGAELPFFTQREGWTRLGRMGGDCWVSDTLLR